MGKNKSFYKKQVKPFMQNNSTVLAAFGGAAAGIAIANILGSDKAKQILQSVEDSAKEYSAKLFNGSETRTEEGL